MADRAAVWAIVVTYNRRGLLPACLRALASQTHSLAGIVLVDNASDDGTTSHLVEQGLLEVPKSALTAPGRHEGGLFPDSGRLFCVYLRLEMNEGGAGGFHEGMASALAQGADWCWLVDDDVEPEPDCLEQLLRWQDHSLCLHPRRRFPDGSYYAWEGYLDVATGNDVFLDDVSFRNGKEICYVNIGCFEGMLVHRQIVELIGLPDKRFFIVYDDTIYGFLASRYTNVAFVRNAVIKKMLPLPREMFPDRFIYYSMRNYFLKVAYLDSFFPRHLYRAMRRMNIIAVFMRFLFYILVVKKRKRSNIIGLVSGWRDGYRLMRDFQEVPAAPGGSMHG